MGSYALFERCGLAPYERTRVARPAPPNVAVPLAEALEATGDEPVADFLLHFCFDKTEAAKARARPGLSRPYSDSKLRSRKKYFELIRVFWGTRALGFFCQPADRVGWYIFGMERTRWCVS